MQKWILPLCFGLLIALCLCLWLAYVIPVGPSLVVRISPVTSGVIKAKALGRVDEQVFYDRVSSWDEARVEACYALAQRSDQAEVRRWAVIAIGHAGTKADIDRIRGLVDSNKLVGSDAEAAAHAIGVLKDRHRF